VTYSNASKTELVGVPADLIERHGAVSAETAEAMAQGGLAYSPASICVAVTGIAGPDGGSADKPVGTVYIAWAMAAGTTSERYVFGGDREQIRQQTIDLALSGVAVRVRSAQDSVD